MRTAAIALNYSVKKHTPTYTLDIHNMKDRTSVGPAHAHPNHQLFEDVTCMNIVKVIECVSFPHPVCMSIVNCSGASFTYAVNCLRLSTA